MSLNQNNYERFSLQELPPHARDVAEYLFSSQPLVYFLKQQQTPEPDIYLLDTHKVPHSMWPEIIHAALLAKLSFFEPNPTLKREQVLFLIQSACKLIGMPLNQYSLEDVIRQNTEQMPQLSRWLISQAQLLKNT